MDKINLNEKFALFSEQWSQKTIGEINDYAVKIAKVQGEFIWHHHDNEDELFYVVKGNFDMHFRDKTITINAGEFLIVPKGIEHKPVAEKEVSIMLFEPATTLNTGNIVDEKTVTNLEFI